MLIYSWIEKFRNLESIGVNFATDYFEITISNCYNTSDTYEKDINIIKKNEPPKVYQNIIVGQNAIGKTNLLGCIAGKHSREGAYFSIYYNINQKSIAIYSEGIKLNVSGSFGNIIQKNINQTQFIYCSKPIATTIPKIEYFSSKSTTLNGSRFGKYSPIVFVNQHNLIVDVKNHFYSIYKFLSDNKIQYSEKFNNIGNLVVSFEDIKDNSNRAIALKFADKKALFLHKLCFDFFQGISSLLFYEDLSEQEKRELKQWRDNKNYIEFYSKFSMFNITYPKAQNGYAIPSNLLPINIFAELVKNLCEYAKRYEYTGILPEKFWRILDTFPSLVKNIVDLSDEKFKGLGHISLPVKSELIDFVESLQLLIKHCNQFTLKECNNSFLSNLIIDIEWLSQGEKQFLALFGLLSETLLEAKAKDVILMFDEPETNLHPMNCLTFRKDFQELVKLFDFESIQLILTTHSPSVVKGCLDGALLVQRIHKDNGGLVVENLISLDKQDSYAKILYNCFNIVSTDYFNELYSRIERAFYGYYIRKSNVNSLTDFFCTYSNGYCRTTDFYMEDKDIKQINKSRIDSTLKIVKAEEISVCEIIRQHIHHADNRFIGKNQWIDKQGNIYTIVDSNSKQVCTKSRYTEQELRDAIEDMLEIIKQENIP